LAAGAWREVLRRSWAELRKDDLTLLAAGLTYYAFVAMAPALLLLVSVLGLVGASAIQPLLDNLTGFAPGPARSVLAMVLHNVQGAGGNAGFGLVAGLGGALWSASGYVGGFVQASNVIYDVEEGRPEWKLRPLQIAVTVALILVSALLALMVVVSGPLARTLGELLGVGDRAVEVWSIVRWPVIGIVVSQVIAFLYWVAPNVRQPGYRWTSPGSLLAVALWVAASAAFAFYVANFGAFGAAYGSLTGVLVLLVWLWITNLAILLGAEVNAELERERALEAGAAPDREPYLPQRDPADESVTR
jgi:membrane protein